MPEIPDNVGVPNVAPDVQSPDDYQQVDATAGKALAGAGQSAVDLTTVLGQVKVSKVTNQTQTNARDLTTQFQQLNATEQLAQAPQYQKQLSAIFDQGESQLDSLDQINEYNNTTRTYQDRYFSGIISDAVGRAAAQNRQAVNNASQVNGLDQIASNPNSDENFRLGFNMMMQGAIRNLQETGGSTDPSVIEATTKEVSAKAYDIRIRNLAVTDPVSALAMAHQDATYLGDAYAPLVDDLQKAARAYSLPSATDGAVAAVLGGNAGAAPVNNPFNLRDPGASTGFRQFPTVEAGIQAGEADLLQKNKPVSEGGDGLSTISQIVTKYEGGTDPSDTGAGNADHNNIAAYIKNVAAAAGVDPNAPIDLSDPLMMAKVSAAFQKQEGSASGFVGPGPTPGQPPNLDQLGANLPYYQQQAAALAAARFPDDPPLAAQAAKQASDQVAKEYGDAVKTRDDAINSNFNLVMGAVQQNHFESVSDLIKAGGPAAAAYAGLPLDKQQSIDAMIAKMVEPVKWSPKVQQADDALMGMSYTNPVGFSQIDLTSPDIVNSLTPDMIQSLSKVQADIGKGLYQGVSVDKLNGALDFVTPMLASAGIPTKDVNGNPYKDNPQYQQFAGVFGQDVSAYFQKNGRMPDATDLRAIASRLLIQGTMAGTGGIFFGPKTERLYQAEAPGGDLSKFQPDIPAPALQSINDAYERQYGHPPDLETAGRLYLENEGAQ